MALPQQVIDRLSKEPPKTPGWSFNVLSFAGGIFFITILVYFGLTLGYGPYLDSQIGKLNIQINTLANSVATDDQAKLVTFYSQITNIKNVLANHVSASRFFSWLEKNTEANVYFSRLTFSSGNQFAMVGFAKTEADVNQQVAIFEEAPEVKNVSLSVVSFVETNGLWQFSITLIMDPASVLRMPQ